MNSSPAPETEQLSPKAELRDLMERAGLRGSHHKDTGQSALARLLKLSDVTVSRWLTDRSDSSDPPRAVILFLRAYVRLNARERAEVTVD